MPLPICWQADSVTFNQLIIYSSTLTARFSSFTLALQKNIPNVQKVSED